MKCNCELPKEPITECQPLFNDYNCIYADEKFEYVYLDKEMKQKYGKIIEMKDNMFRIEML